LKTIAPIKREMRNALLTPPLGPAGSRPDDYWMQKGGPVKYVTIGLANGAVMELPGAGWNPGDYDPRVRPWYALGSQSEGVAWGSPFPSFAGGPLLMPCSLAFRDDQQSVMGVVSVQTSFEFLIQHHLMTDDPTIRETFLLDSSGDIMLRSSDAGLRQKGRSDQVHETPPFHHAGLLPEIKQRPSGYLELDGTLLAWDRLQLEGWTLVIEADPI